MPARPPWGQDLSRDRFTNSFCTAGAEAWRTMSSWPGARGPHGAPHGSTCWLLSSGPQTTPWALQMPFRSSGPDTSLSISASLFIRSEDAGIQSAPGVTVESSGTRTRAGTPRSPAVGHSLVPLPRSTSESPFCSLGGPPRWRYHPEGPVQRAGMWHLAPGSRAQGPGEVVGEELTNPPVAPFTWNCTW